MIKKSVRKFDTLRKRNEGFKDTDRLSPSEVVAVCSQWSRSAGDSFKYDGGEFISFDVTPRDSYFGMHISIERATGEVDCLFLNMSNDDMADTASQFLDDVKSKSDCDEVWYDLTLSVGEDLNNEAEYCSGIEHLSGRVTRRDVEAFLDKCLDKAQRAETGLEAEFQALCEAKLDEDNQMEESLVRRVRALEKAIKAEACKSKKRIKK